MQRVARVRQRQLIVVYSRSPRGFHCVDWATGRAWNL